MSVNAATNSIYGGTYIGDYSVTGGSIISFDKERFQEITSLSGSVVTPSDTTAGSYGPVTGSISLYSPSSTGSQSGSFTIHSGTISDYGHTDSVSLSVQSSNNVYYTNAHARITTGVSLPSDGTINPNKYYEVVMYMDNFHLAGGSATYDVNSPFFYDYVTNKERSASWSKHEVVRGSDLIFNSNYLYLVRFEFDLVNPQSSAISCTWDLHCGVIEVSEEVYSAHSSSATTDSGTQERLDTNNQIAQENTDTNKDTNNKVTNFFNAFWDNLLHIFVPEDGFFSSWFNELNDFFAAKLGFLYAPFDFIISFFNGVLNTVGTQEHGFTIPSLSWDGTEFCPEVHFSFDMFAEEFPQLQEAVYFFSDVVIILALMRGIRAKLDLVMGVHEE